MLTQEELKKFLHYDPDTGIFTWIQQPRRRTKIGSVAGCRKEYYGKSYIQMQFKCKDYFAHRLAWLYMTGEFPNDEIDHINGDGTDNKFINLRSVTRSVNCKNLRLKSNNRSGVCGIYFDKQQNKWRAQVMVEGKNVYLGSFSNKSDAIIVRKKAEKLHIFHANHGSDRPL